MRYYFATMRGILDDADAIPIIVENPWGSKDIRCWGDTMGKQKVSKHSLAAYGTDTAEFSPRRTQWSQATETIASPL
jgi:hypothetical protein